MFRRLFHRNVALLVAVVLVGQLLAGFLVMRLVIRPQVDRVAEATTTIVSALSQAMAGMDPAHRADLVKQINRNGGLAIRPLAEVPPDGLRFPSMVERQYLLALASHLADEKGLTWRTDGVGRLWFKLGMGGEDYWVSLTPPRARGALASLVLSLLAAFVVAAVCGLALQRRIDAPLRRLAHDVDGYRTDGTQTPLDTTGPEEIAAVAGALNRMNDRIAGQESERALMLAGVSHDLRTPLTRLRLSLEMLRGQDEELEASATRQVDAIEAMLGQFLDFARGFHDEAPEIIDVATLLGAALGDAMMPENVTLDVPAGLSFPLRPQAVRRAVSNLLVNAVRHGAAPVAIAARLDSDRLRIEVSDGGAGIASEIADQLRRPFARGDSARGGDGTGLGLVIIDRVAAAHGGSLTFERRDGRFVAVLTLARA